MAVARLAGGRTTKRGTFGHTEHDAYPKRAFVDQRGEADPADQAEIERQHILATATSKAGFALMARCVNAGNSRQPGCFRFAEA